MVALRSQQQHICISSSTIRCVPDIWLASNKKECLINIIGIFVPVVVNKYAWKKKKFPFAFIFSFYLFLSILFTFYCIFVCFSFLYKEGPRIHAKKMCVSSTQKQRCYWNSNWLNYSDWPLLCASLCRLLWIEMNTSEHVYVPTIYFNS